MNALAPIMGLSILLLGSSLSANPIHFTERLEKRRLAASSRGLCGSGMDAAVGRPNDGVEWQTPEWFHWITPPPIRRCDGVNIYSDQGQRRLNDIALTLTDQEAQSIFAYITRTDLYDFPLHSLQELLIQVWPNSPYISSLRVSRNMQIGLFLLLHYDVRMRRIGRAPDLSFPAGLHILRRSRANGLAAIQFGFLAQIALARPAQNSFDALVQAVLEMPVESTYGLFALANDEDNRIDRWIGRFLDAPQLIRQRPPNAEKLSMLVQRLFSYWQLNFIDRDVESVKAAAAIETLSVRMFNFLQAAGRPDLAGKYSEVVLRHFARLRGETPAGGRSLRPLNRLSSGNLDDLEIEILDGLEELEASTAGKQVVVETAHGILSFSLGERQLDGKTLTVVLVEGVQDLSLETFETLVSLLRLHSKAYNRQVLFPALPAGSELRREFENKPDEYELVGIGGGTRPATFRIRPGEVPRN